MWKNHKPTEDLVVNELREDTMREVSTVVPCSTASAHLQTAFPQLNLHRARVLRNHKRLPSNDFIERAKTTLPASGWVEDWRRAP